MGGTLTHKLDLLNNYSIFLVLCIAENTAVKNYSITVIIPIIHSSHIAALLFEKCRLLSKNINYRK